MQGSGEEATFTEEQMLEMLSYSKQGIATIVEKQNEALRAFDPTANVDLLARFE